MADDMLAYSRPFGVVLRRQNPVGADVGAVLYRDAEPEIRLDAVLHQIRKQQIRKREVVVGRIRLVGVEVAEEIGNIHEDVLAVGAADIVQARIRNSRFLQISEHPESGVAEHGRLSDAVDRLDRPDALVEVHFEHGDFRRADPEYRPGEHERHGEIEPFHLH